MLVDTHVHLDFYDTDEEIKAVVKRASQKEVSVLVAVGYNLSSCKRAVELANSFPKVYAAIGIHPHEASSVTPQLLKDIKELAANNRVVAFGETGLDFYRNDAPQVSQKEAFRHQTRLARELTLPLIVHSREAYKEVLEIMDEEEVPKAVFHCFSGGDKVANECLARNYYISVAGPITFQNAARLREVIKDVPLDRILLETDSPFLAPQPYRGKTNEPAYLPLIAKVVAEVKEISEEEVKKITTGNAFTFFGLNNIVLKS